MMSKCIICNGLSEFYFSKEYLVPPFDEFMRSIGEIQYFKCSNCGFVLSETHKSLDDSVWSSLNDNFHHYMEKRTQENKINQPPYTEQAFMISVLGQHKIIDTKSMIDYAGGYGTLSKILEQYFNIFLPVYDPYVTNALDSSRYINKKDLVKYKTVINSAMFEHVRYRKDLDDVNELVDHDGCLIIHSVICEDIPKDPNWFYLDPPVHTAFHTNKSMSILMDQWGYQSSIYSPKSKCWILMKNNDLNIKTRLMEINRSFQTEWFIYSDGFVDYWK